MQVNGMVEVDQDVAGEAEALTQGIHAALRMIQVSGVVTPTAIALMRNRAGWRGIWQMDITQAIKRGNEGMQELGYVLSKLVSPTGCNLSAMGVAPEHFKADGVLVVVEGKAQSNGPDAPQQAEWRSVSVELRTHGHACALLYRVTEQGNEVGLEFVARASKITSPLDVDSAAIALH